MKGGIGHWGKAAPAGGNGPSAGEVDGISCGHAQLPWQSCYLIPGEGRGWLERLEGAKKTHVSILNVVVALTTFCFDVRKLHALVSMAVLQNSLIFLPLMGRS